MLYANSSLCRMWNVSLEDVIDRNFWTCFPKLKGTVIEENFRDAMEKNEYRHFDTKGYIATGYYEAKVIPAPKGISIVLNDITKRKRAEDTLLQKQKELTRILDSSPVIIFYKDKEGKLIQANEAFAEVLRVPKESLLGKTVFDLYSAELAQNMTNDDIEVFNSKLPKLGIEEPYESPTGVRWIKTDKYPTFAENGEVIGLIGFSEDITERKKAEEALIRDNRRFNEILESISDDFMVLDFNWNFVYANSQASKLVGLEPEDIVGKNFWELFPKNKGTPFEQNLREAMERREVRRFEIHGQYCGRDKLMSTYPSVEGIALIATDITERKKLEKKVKESEHFAAIGQTAGMVGHDLRNPLQTIISELYLAEGELKTVPEGPLKAALKESLEDISEQVVYMDKIVSDLQTFVKPVEAHKQIVNLKELTVSTLAQVNVPENIQTHMSIDEKIKLNIDPQLLKRVLINLMTNSVQAMPQGGEITIQGNTDARKKKARITVTDNGPGISEEIKPKIFTPLFTTKAKGQGFGLAVCKRVIEAQGGVIYFESKVGMGAKFIMDLPLCK
ncbi:MAG: PAS domain-containing protein [Candidatus Bathyarchaeota archaeon]|nr:PAS domain-containing protein [Candidatus Bathyarchaeota archaeon]